MKYLLIVLALLSVNAFAQEQNWPTTLDNAVETIISKMDENFKEKVRSTKEEDLILYHFGWGSDIRNSYGLWNSNEALLLSACGGKLCHPDNASMNIITAIWAKLSKNP